jgi:hypothetical protein
VCSVIAFSKSPLSSGPSIRPVSHRPVTCYVSNTKNVVRAFCVQVGKECISAPSQANRLCVALLPQRTKHPGEIRLSDIAAGTVAAATRF